MKQICRIILSIGLLAWVFPASAVVISFTVETADNDCAGYYSNPNNFESCIIFAEDLGQGEGDISSVVAKWDAEDGWDDISPMYPEFDPNDVDVSSIDPEDSAGSFTYTGDPSLIRFWVAKSASFAGFQVFYDTDDADCVDANAGTFACMTTANAISGTYNWFTAGGQGISHLTFYDTEVRKMSEPATLALLGMGLLALVAVRRRRQSA